MKTIKLKRGLLIALGASLFFTISGLNLKAQNLGASKAPVTDIDPRLMAFDKAFSEVAERVSPSIVQITVVVKAKEEKMQVPDEFKFFFPFKDEGPHDQQGGGSGVIVSSDGYIITNNHVVENASQVTVTLPDKRKFDANVVGTDPLTDLAVIKVNAKGLPEAYLGNSDKVKLGQWVLAIGNPLFLNSTITAGIVSAKGRSLHLIKDSYGVENYIQTDAAINPGNSGGALVDLSGAVIGINSAIATNGMSQSYIGYGFAIPINLAKSVAQDLISNGKVNRGYIGINISEVDAATAKALGLDRPKGVMVQGIVEDGAAKGRDIKAGDVILKIDGRDVDEPNELQSYVTSKRAGTELKLELFRDGKTIERTVILKAKNGEKVEEASLNKSKRNLGQDENKELSLESIGLTVKNATNTELRSYDSQNGILITKVKEFSKTYSQGLFAGLLIVEVDRERVDRVSDFEKIVNNKKGQALLLKLVDAKGNTRFVGLEIPE